MTIAGCWSLPRASSQRSTKSSPRWRTDWLWSKPWNAKKEFREDLFYRISMVEVALPPLRARSGDIPALLHHALAQCGSRYRRPVAGFTAQAMSLLTEYPWPGNIRELENAMGHACMMAEGETLDVDDLPAALQEGPRGANSLLRFPDGSFDRGKLRYLNMLERINCLYCSYANGVASHSAEIAARTERHWCPIQHKIRCCHPYSRQDRFLPYGDAEAYRAKVEKVRRDFRGLDGSR